MDRNSQIYKGYLETLETELMPAMGCTEPIAISFAAAKARSVLGAMPDRVLVEASGNLIKNVKSVIVPNTDGLKGIEAASAAGIVAGNPEKMLEVISEVTAEQKEEIRDFLNNITTEVQFNDSGIIFDLIVTLFSKDQYAKVRIINEHTNIIYIEKNGEVLFEKAPDTAESGDSKSFKMSVDGILEFAKTCDLNDVKDIIGRQIEYNTAISTEGIKNDWGANIGSLIIKTNDSKDVRVRAKAYAAAGSDARMSGCEMPVVINSGSGNQGITVSVPVIEHAKELGSSEEELYRALVLSNLLGLHQKAGIGRLSAYCGAVSAGCSAGAAIAFLQHESDDVIKHTIVNCLAITSGIVCDGAKPSCAAKIASSIDACYLALDMAKNNSEFKAGEGIVKKGIEDTISSVAKLGKDGMKETDKEILKIMIN